MRPRRVLALVLAVLVVLLGTAGCASIPVRSAVQTGAPLDDDQASDLSFLPATPKPGAAPTDIVSNFIYAATGQQNDYAVAREFLAPAMARTWRPEAQVLVQNGGGAIKQTGPTTVTYTVPVVARLDSRGQYRPAPASAPPKVLTFTVGKVKGEWRITAAPDGVVLASSALDRLFPQRRIAFFDPTFTRIVPDWRWFPTGGSRAAPTDAIVRALLAGPATPLVGAAATAFPTGTTLHSSVRTVGAASVVDLHFPGPEPGMRALERMQAQLTASLPVDTVRLAVDGIERLVPNITPEASPQPDPRPLVVRGGAVGYLDDSGRLVPDTVLGRLPAKRHVLGLTVSDLHRVAVLRTAEGVTLISRAGTRLVDKRPGLVDPTVDPLGWAYSVPRSDPSALQAFDARGTVRKLPLPVPASATVQSIEVSPEGARLLVLTNGPDGPRAFVVGIRRDSRGAPVSLSTARFPIAIGMGAGVDATWVDPLTVATVAAAQDGDDVVTQAVGGLAEPTGRLSNATALVGGAKQADLTARLDDGDLATLRGSVWIPSPAGVQALGVQR